MIKGLNEISDLLRFYKHKQSACLQDPDEPAHVDLLKTIQELYADIFEYQVRLICLLAKRWSKVGDNTIALNDWISMLKRVKDSDGKCNEENNAVLSDEKAHLLYENETHCIERSVDIRNYVIDTFEASRTTRREEGRDKNDAELLATIASDYKSDKDSVPARVTGTCEWFFEDERFLNWRSSKSSSVLWLSAGPGFGKSVLSRALVDEKRVCNHITTSSVCYFFFKDGQERRTRGAHSLSAILHQLFENTDLISHALPTYRRHGQTLRDNFSALWDILVRSAKDVEAGDIICIFDALDECEEDARDQLISKLTDFALQNDLHQQFPFSLKFLVTSRPYDDIEGQFERLSGTSTYLRINGDEKSQKVGQEIDLVIDAEIPKIIGDFTDEGRQLISDSLKTMNNRTYLWLYLTIDIIKRSRSNYRTISSIKALMRDLPPKVSDAYSRILDRSSNEPLARKLLQMMVVAIRPLSLMEANVALALAKQPDCASHKMLEFCSSQTLKSTIQNICGLFVTIHDEKLSLIHQTAREFLVQRTEKGGKPSDQWQGCFDMATANSTMFRICLSYLNFEEFDPNQHQYEYDDQLLVEAENDSYPFFNYAALHWTAHYNSQKSESAKEEQTAAQTLCDTYTSSPKRLGWWQFYLTYKLGWIHSEKWTGLGIASFLGLIYVVQSFLEEGLDFNTLDSSHNALHLASHAGHETIVRILLDKGADINGRTMNETALHIASRECQEKVVQVLIHYGADVNAETLRGNALKFASAAGNNKILKMLLERGAKMDDSLYVAAFRGHDEVVKTLLESGADVNEQNEDRESALHRASFMGYEKVVQILLEYRANVKAENKIRATALHLASHQGHDNVVQMLLRHGAEINAKDANHETALHYASSQGCEIVVQTLLKHGADVNAQPAHQQSALQTAALRGYNKIVEILANHGADVNAQDPFGKTALQTASEQGDEVMVQTLLENGADVCQMDLQGRNSLHLASAKGERKIVENLVENIRSLGLNLKKVDGQGRNCLHHAACGGFAALVSWFIEKGMDPNIADLNGWTALHWAAKNGLSDDTDWAAQNKSLDTVEVLLRAGAKSTVEAIKGWTPYLVAVFHDNSLDILNVPRACEPTGSGLSIENVAETSTTGSRSVSPGTWTGIMCNGCSLVSLNLGKGYRCFRLTKTRAYLVQFIVAWTVNTLITVSNAMHLRAELMLVTGFERFHIEKTKIGLEIVLSTG